MSGWKNNKESIYLIGPRASGKTTLAREIAAHMNLSARDTDEQLEWEQGKSIQDLVALYGWEHFRDLEEQILADISGSRGLVVATGGGIVLRKNNREVLKSPENLTVYLAADANMVLQRLARDPNTGQRPALSSLPQEEEVRGTLAEREPLYRECADVVLSADCSLEGLVREVMQAL